MPPAAAEPMEVPPYLTSSNLGTRNLSCYFFLRSNHILTMQTTKNHNLGGTRPRMEQSQCGWTCVCLNVNIVFHKSKMRPSVSMFYSLLYSNWQRGHSRLKHLSPVIWSQDRKTTRHYWKSAIYPFVDGQSAISPSLVGKGSNLEGLKSDFSWFGPIQRRNDVTRTPY